ncbi:hypothetical protein [Mongoliitalea daihaiensis]|uniref:hypothetical protein n=1 Tax=Mongoliitalea daihaiensis TaxID=2782006 RepID=UPI001F37D699|nr:hypothetical protein [Mongoliitalea daihaiensis]UJP66434.1 hypothetical protein IPZ59_07490 [Mongoliitalea daihaiensis]
MNQLLSVISLFISINLSAQDITGSWIWEESGKTFDLSIEKTDSLNYIGSHSSIFQNGNRIDTSLDEQSISLTKVSNHIYEGTIKSFYDHSIQKVRITYIPSEDAIEWWIYEDNQGDFYFPRRVKMERF